MDWRVWARLRSATRRTGVEVIGPEAQAMGEAQIAQLIVFIAVVTTLLLALEVGMRRAQRRRGAQRRR